MSDEYLVLTAVGTDRPGIVAELTALLAEHGANVADSRMAVLGGEFALMMLISAAGDQLATVRQEIGPVAEQLGLQFLIRETGSPSAHRAGNVRSYEIRVHALDHPGIVHKMTTALRRLDGNIISLDTHSYQAPVTGATLFQMSFRADFPADVTAARLREALSHVSEAVNADLDVNPV
jgi:glycine cleavage system transcriptional repressor